MYQRRFLQRDFLAEVSPGTVCLQFDMHSDQDEGYSSFPETEGEELGGKGHASAAWLSHLGAAAAYQPWPPGTKGLGRPSLTR